MRGAAQRDARCDPRVNVRCAAERAPEDEQTPRGDWLSAWVHMRFFLFINK